MTPLDRTATTYRYERWRAPAAGVLESAASIFLLLIAVRWYGTGPLGKALIAGGGSVGLLLAPWAVSWVERARWPVARGAARLAAVSALSFLAMALVPLQFLFVLGSVVALAATNAAIPLLTQMYQENYPAHQRGRLFARAMMLRIAAAAAFSHLAGLALSRHLSQFRWLLLLFAGAATFAGFCLARCPSRPLVTSGGAHPFHALRYVRSDRLFRQTLIAWMFLGFATLMMVPLRVEYLANPKYGVQYHGQPLTAGMVALFTGVIPNLARLALNPVWGWLFDHMNFFLLRITLNFGFALGILSFFATGSLAGLIAGALLFGVSGAGADVAWSLWVTKFAPPDRVADYMSVHTCFTGLRGVLAPLAAFSFISGLPLSVLGWVSAALILTSCLFLLPEIKFGKSPRPAAALIEETTD